MQVLKVSRIFGSRKEKYCVHIFLDDSSTETQFPLYLSEIKRYGIEEGLECEDSLYYKIEKEVLKKRILARCGYLLGRRGYSSKELKEKLCSDHYGTELAEMAVSKMRALSYINDEDYCIRYIELNQNKKSSRLIMKELEAKGIDMSAAAAYLPEEADDDTLKKLAEKNAMALI